MTLSGAIKRESVLRDYLFEHPELLFSQPVLARDREVRVEGKYVDLIFHVDGIHYIVELKRETITREAVGQVMEYYGRLCRLHRDRIYRMILVAPSIPAYRSEPLEHFGIRCAEIGFPEDTADSPEDFAPAIPAQRVATVIRKSDWISNAARQTEGSFTTTDLLPPATREAREMAHELLLDGLVAMEELFLQFEIMPIRMGHVERPDLLCILGPHDAVQLLKVGIWWAYAFGASEQMAKNDTPNLSVNALPWGLDFAINAELMTSQRVLLSRVTSAPDTFNKLVAEHGNLELQVWLKIEFRPRFYHWISLNRVAGDARAAESLLERHQEAIRDYEQLKSYWVNRLSEPDAKMSAAELLHMRSRNQNPNIALRVVRTFAPGDAVWGMDVEHQKQSFRDEYAALKPLIEFFN